MKILTVCLGNICRSPAAQGILEYIAEVRSIPVTIDSAGTAAYHIGNQPDQRSIKALKEIGIDISTQRARKVCTQDFYDFDWILVMDRQNLSNLMEIMPTDASARVVMFGEFDGTAQYGEVSDPYYGREAGFTLMREHLVQIAEDFFGKHYE
ncbi:low molecular weight protein-tyrosine-phosphatase [Marinomonas ostreistagni]|uniref:protein-tyrosine-phosphatase n=1 Tax=Marinomonas ostreistagni TaxID=359209 RepID=A0ABS0Z711_9GAMM|nr:low molecular weight protein-tyrosine-phosphatase [Marinomonas ostreistagni]MBJ7549439.1 low molecular weight phosphotyrosine protein phosphatase [Marinomonas ostreistagni]